MKFIFKSRTLLSRTAKRLQEIFPAYTSESEPAPLNWKEATAYTLGHESLRALKAAAEQTSEADSHWDEACTRAELEARRLYQAGRLGEYTSAQGVQLKKIPDIIAIWQPTAARPQTPVLTPEDIEELRAVGVPHEAFLSLLSYERTDSVPTLDDLELFRRGLKSSIGFINQAIPLYIAPLAVRLVNRQTSPAAEIGVALLEMLCETKFAYPKVNLARALRSGWGVARNMERAKVLCESVNKALDAGEDVFVNPVSWIDFYTLWAQLLAESDSYEERIHAFNCVKEAASHGSGPAALQLAHYYSPLPPGEESDVFSGIVQPNMEASLYYFQLAIRRGYDTDTHTFPDGAI